METIRREMEFGIHINVTHICVLQSEDLDSEVPKQYFTEDFPCHLYAIGTRPRITLDPKYTKAQGDILRFVFEIQEKGTSKSKYLLLGNGPQMYVSEIVTEYPYNNFKFVDAEGKILIGGKPTLFLQTLYGKGIIPYDPFLDFEIKYIGQAFGASGERLAPSRLKSHSTLQKILSDVHRKRPDQEVWIALFAIEYIMINMISPKREEPGVNFISDPERDAAVFKRVLHDELDEKQRVNFSEAALIKYFSPEYNTIYKESFPSKNHTSYKECYEIDFNTVSLELNSTSTFMQLKSDSRKPLWNHMHTFYFHDAQSRKQMFDFDINATPDGH